MGARTLLSIEDFAKLPDEGLLYELDDGELITMAPASEEHGDIGAEFTMVLRQFVKAHGSGKVYNADTGFRLSRDTVRAPDVAFVRKDRLGPRASKSFFEGTPDLAVEIFSPSDSVPQLMRKVRQYFTAGTHTVWVVYSESRQVHVFEAAGKDRILNADDALECSELLPGFGVQIGALFE